MPSRESLRSLGTDTIWAGIQDLTTLIAALATFTILLSTFSTAEYGAYLGAYGVIAPLTGLAWNGVSLVALQRVLREREAPQQVASACFAILFGVGGVVGVISIGLAVVLVPTLGLVDIAGLALAELVGSAMVGVSSAFVQALKGYAAAARIRIILPILKVTVVGSLAALDELTVRNLGFSLALVHGSVSLFLLLRTLPRLGVHLGFARPSRAVVTTTRDFSFPILVSSVQADGDKAVLNFYGFPAIAGTYGAAFKLIQFALMPINAFDGAAFQRFLNHDPNARGQHLRRARQSATFTVPLSLVMAAALFVAAPILPAVVGDQFGDSVAMTRALLLMVPIYALTTAPMNGLLGLGKTTLRSQIYIGAAVVSVLLYVVLIPLIDWRGALIGTVVGESVIAVAGWASLVIMQRRHDNHLDPALDRSALEFAQTEGAADVVS